MGSAGSRWTGTYVISGLNLGGENISGHGLHQFDGILFSPGTKKTLPLFVVAGGKWLLLGELDTVKPRTMLESAVVLGRMASIGPNFRNR